MEIKNKILSISISGYFENNEKNTVYKINISTNEIPSFEILKRYSELENYNTLLLKR
jgi:hypothetical protein